MEPRCSRNQGHIASRLPIVAGGSAGRRWQASGPVNRPNWARVSAQRAPIKQHSLSERSHSFIEIHSLSAILDHPWANTYRRTRKHKQTNSRDDDYDYDCYYHNHPITTTTTALIPITVPSEWQGRHPTRASEQMDFSLIPCTFNSIPFDLISFHLFILHLWSNSNSSNDPVGSVMR